MPVHPDRFQPAPSPVAVGPLRTLRPGRPTAWWWAKGSGILVLKRLADAIEHGDTIHGVIHGIGLSNDMRGNLLAPESRGQVRAMQGLPPPAGSHRTWISSNATAPAPAPAIPRKSKAWSNSGRMHPQIPGVCAIGSVKSMIGHLLTAAGAAGMIKTLLAMRTRRCRPRSILSRPRKDSPLEGSPFKVQTQASPWNSPRRPSAARCGQRFRLRRHQRPYPV
jgi:3-oxoacyl-(acyl-carrier-protein) synthase